MISKYAPKRIDFLINENDIFEEKRLIKALTSTLLRQVE